MVLLSNLKDLYLHSSGTKSGSRWQVEGYPFDSKINRCVFAEAQLDNSETKQFVGRTKMDAIMQAIDKAVALSKAINTNHAQIVEAVGTVAGGIAAALKVMRQRRIEIAELEADFKDAKVTLAAVASKLAEYGIVLDHTIEGAEAIKLLSGQLNLYSQRIEQFTELLSGTQLIATAGLVLDNYFRDRRMFNGTIATKLDQASRQSSPPTPTRT